MRDGGGARLVRDVSMRDADNAYARGAAVAKQAFALMTEFVERYSAALRGASSAHFASA